MATARKKIYVIILSSLPGFSRDDLKLQLRELQLISDLELIEISDQPACEFGMEKWIPLAQRIISLQEQALAFVIVSGLDNVLLMSSAFSFLLSPLPCPVIFTGSSGLFIDDKKMEARANLINSVQIAKFGINEVGLMFGNRLLRANQCGFAEELSLNIFNAPQKAVLGRIDFSVRLEETYLPPKFSKTKTARELFTDISLLNLPLRTDGELIDPGSRALAINLRKQQQLPKAVFSQLEKFAQSKPVMIYLERQSRDFILPNNAVLATGLTFDAALAKFMWILPQTKQPAKIKELMEKNIAGEYFD